jgi:mRNA interferase MazF
MKRDEIYRTRFDPVEGSEIGKTRPAVIVSLDVLNERLETVVVCPLTSTIHPHWQTRLRVTATGREANICADQIRGVSKRRLGKKLGKLSPRDAL